MQAVPIMWTGWEGVCHGVCYETCCSVSPPKIVWLLPLLYFSWGRLQGLVFSHTWESSEIPNLVYNLLSNFRMIWIMSLDSWCWPGNLLFRELIGHSRWALPFQLVISISYSCDIKPCFYNMHDIEGLILYCKKSVACTWSCAWNSSYSSLWWTQCSDLHLCLSLQLYWAGSTNRTHLCLSNLLMAYLCLSCICEACFSVVQCQARGLCLHTQVREERHALSSSMIYEIYPWFWSCWMNESGSGLTNVYFEFSQEDFAFHDWMYL